MATDKPIPVGPELDAAVAETVMGWRWCEPWKPLIGGKNPHWPLSGAWDTGNGYEPTWHPSTFWADAGRVLEWLRKQGWEVSICSYADCWIVWADVDAKRHSQVEDVGDTGPEAICRAALAATEKKGGE